MAGIHRERPGAVDLAAATDTPAQPLGDGVWMSPGVSNSYAVATDEGRVIVNGGLVFEGPLHRKAFADVPGPTRAIVVTQGHADHWGGVNSLRDEGTLDTQVVMHRNYRYWRDDNTLLMSLTVGGRTFELAWTPGGETTDAPLADTENFWERAWLTKSIDELRTTE